MAALEWTPAERNGVEATGDVTNRPGPYKSEDFARFCVFTYETVENGPFAKPISARPANAAAIP